MGIKPLDRLLFAQGKACFFCSAHLPREEATVEHLVAQANGGSNADHNCVACCRDINILLGSLSLKEKLRIVLNQKGKFVCPKRAASVAASPPVSAAKHTPAAPVSKPKQTAPVPPIAITPGLCESEDCQSGLTSEPSCDCAVAATSGCSPNKKKKKKKSSSGHSPEHHALVLKDLERRGESRPKRVESLRNTIRSVVKAAKGSLTDPQLESLLNHLQAEGIILISGTVVSYSRSLAGVSPVSR